MKQLTVPQTNTIQIKQARNLYIRKWEKSEIEFRYHGKLEQELQNDQFSVSCKSNLLVAVPENVNIIIDKIEGNCKLFGELGNIVIDRVDGNFEGDSLKSTRICSIGGNCKINSVILSIEIEKIAGNCYVNHCQGEVKFEKINGNFHCNGENIQIDCKVGGNVHLHTNSFSGTENKISAGGNIKLNLNGSEDISFLGTSGGSYNLDVGGVQLKGKAGKFQKKIGSGQKNVTLSAGGSLQVNDRGEVEAPKFQFSGDKEKLWNEVEGEVDTFLSDLEFIDLSGLNKLDEKLVKLNKIAENSESSGIDIDFTNIANNDSSAAMESQSNFENRKIENSVSEKEKMIVLKMLQEKKITAEEADRLLQALEQ